MFKEEVLAYLAMDIDCKINYKAKHNKSIKEILGIDDEPVLFLKTNDLLPAFSNFYVKRTMFYKMFGKQMINTSSRRKAMKVADVSKAFHTLRHRKDVIENWKTTKDVWEAVGKPVAFGTFQNNIAPRFTDGSINFEEVSIGKEGPIGLTYKIDPKDFPRLVKEEKEKYKQAEGVTIKEIVKRFGYGYMSIRNKVAIARERQLIKLEKSRGRAFVISEDYLPNLFMIFASRFKSRDQRTISVLMELYADVFDQAAEIYVQGMEHQEKVGLAQMSFFEMVKEEDFRVFEEGNVKAIQDHMKAQLKAEKPTWLSLDKPMGEDGQRWGDLIADESEEYEEQYL